MTKKEPELQIKTSLAKFAGFFKALALIVVLLGGTAGSSYLTNQYNAEDELAKDRTRDSLITVLKNDIKEHEVRIAGIEATNVDIKSDLTVIRTDIKQLLYMAGKQEGRK